MAWDLPPPAVQDYIKSQHQQIAQLQNQIETLQGRVEQTSHTSSKPPSSDAPFNTPQRQRKKSAGKRGGQKGHRGSGPTWLSPTEVHRIEPGPWACGHGKLVSLPPSHTQQVIALPPIEMDIHHFVLQQGQCQGCGRDLKAQGPREHQAGSGPRLSALIGALAGMPRTSWRLVQDFCHAVLPISISLGAVPKGIPRVAQAIVPHYEAIATLARQPPVGYSDDTPWYGQNAVQWLWTMPTDPVSLDLMHPQRSQDAFRALLEEWQGLLVSDGDGVYHTWVHDRQPCLAPRSRSARGLAQKRAPELAPCGTWALTEWQAWCHRAKAPPTGGQWRAGYARFCHLLDRYHERHDDAGRLTRRLQRERASRWVFLREQGVEATNNRAERSLRFAVMWRTGSSGTDREAGNRWVERTFSLRQTCRQLGPSTFGVLVDAVTSFFQGRQPDLAWLY
jgi:transposase